MRRSADERHPKGLVAPRGEFAYSSERTASSSVLREQLAVRELVLQRLSCDWDAALPPSSSRVRVLPTRTVQTILVWIYSYVYSYSTHFIISVSFACR